ncbi:alpha/beta-hydrolase [Microthyrium microscopicum]|uniref:Alpha/beta-hydrolase n=1 Tax=Microthyrium microscopicum TaxID=703497 RepID=A0A6A6U426_9PEZI|nr:alpha/beta-hydrolase [Microthyrium microscopicum]
MKDFWTILVTLQSLLSLAFTVPVPDKLNVRDVRAISQSDFDTISLYEQYAAAAYCPSNFNGSVPALVTCRSNNCDLVQKAKAAAIYKIAPNSLTDTRGYIAVDNVNKLIVVAFRGSETVANFLANLLSIFLTRVDLCTGCQGGSGFWISWTRNRAQIIQQVKNLLNNPARQNYTVLVTGHSLGGAIGNFAAFELRIAFPKTTVDMATFGAPATGNLIFTSQLSKQDRIRGRNFRVNHLGDPVPNLPPIRGFTSVTPAFTINTANQIVPAPKDFTMLEGASALNPGVTNPFDFMPHAFYINAISACFVTPAAFVANITLPLKFTYGSEYPQMEASL